MLREEKKSDRYIPKRDPDQGSRFSFLQLRDLREKGIFFILERVG
jgi:hypothetical protein